MLIDCRSFRVARHTDGGMTISGENDEGSASLYFSPDKVAMLLDAAQPPPLFATAEDINRTIAAEYEQIEGEREEGKSWGTIGERHGVSGWRVQRAFLKEQKSRSGTLRPAGRPKTKKGRKS